MDTAAGGGGFSLGANTAGANKTGRTFLKARRSNPVKA